MYKDLDELSFRHQVKQLQSENIKLRKELKALRALRALLVSETLKKRKTTD